MRWDLHTHTEGFCQVLMRCLHAASLYTHLFKYICGFVTTFYSCSFHVCNLAVYVELSGTQ